jgi:hypothetical protein
VGETVRVATSPAYSLVKKENIYLAGHLCKQDFLALIEMVPVEKRFMIDRKAKV